MKSNGTIAGTQKRLKATPAGTWPVSGETHAFTQTEGAVQGQHAHREFVLVSVKTATGFGSPKHRGGYTPRTSPGFEEGSEHN